MKKVLSFYLVISTLFFTQFSFSQDLNNKENPIFEIIPKDKYEKVIQKAVEEACKDISMKNFEIFIDSIDDANKKTEMLNRRIFNSSMPSRNMTNEVKINRFTIALCEIVNSEIIGKNLSNISDSDRFYIKTAKIRALNALRTEYNKEDSEKILNSIIHDVNSEYQKVKK